MTRPVRHLQAVPGARADEHDRHEHRPERPGALAEALSRTEGAPEEVVLLRGLADDDAATDPSAAAFLRMAERADKIEPLHGDKSRLDAAELLRLIGAPDQAALRATQAGAAERAEALDALVRAAWDVVRTGAVAGDEELQACLVRICTHLADGSA